MVSDHPRQISVFFFFFFFSTLLGGPPVIWLLFPACSWQIRCSSVGFGVYHWFSGHGGRSPEITVALPRSLGSFKWSQGGFLSGG